MYALFRLLKDSERLAVHYLTLWLGRINWELAQHPKENFAPVRIVSSDMIPSPDNPYVTWGQFEWIIGGILTAQASISGATLMVVRWMLRSHDRELEAEFEARDKENTAKFDALGKRLEIEHSENKAALQSLRADMLNSNQQLFEELRSIRRLFDEFLLKQLPPR